MHPFSFIFVFIFLLAVDLLLGVGSSSVVTSTSSYDVTSRNVTFEWYTSGWSACVHRNPVIDPYSRVRDFADDSEDDVTRRGAPSSDSCCTCYRTRNVTCVAVVVLMTSSSESHRFESVTAPFHCLRRLPLVTPPTGVEPCRSCRQDCVTTVWSAWSPSLVDGVPYDDGRGMVRWYRTRSVLVMPGDGGNPCGPLVETEVRSPQGAVGVLSKAASFRWQMGQWTGCRMPEGAEASSDETSDTCTGVRYRHVTCVNETVNTTAPDGFCLFHNNEESKPAEREQCRIPCDCLVGRWGRWGQCSTTCHYGAHDGTDFSLTGYQTRTRDVIRPRSDGGVDCPALKEVRPCDWSNLPPCKRYNWRKSNWTECSIDQRDASTRCDGRGFQSRDVVCVEADDSFQRQVDDSLCFRDRWAESNILKPTNRKACHVPCPVDCQLGEWQNWSTCTKSCGTGGYQIRTRPVLVEPSHGGQECGIRFMTKPCETVPCLWWHIAEWSHCFPNEEPASPAPSSCSTSVEGRQYRTVYCLNALDETLSDAECLRLVGPKPSSDQRCRVPCNRHCTVSEWSTWSQCSASCGVRGGTQGRYRRIGWFNASLGPCLSDSELKQTRPCNQRPCEVHLWQVSAWSPCHPAGNSTLKCGEPSSGLQVRSVYCEAYSGFADNSSLCDVTLKPAEKQRCAAICPLHCELSEWSEWSSCIRGCTEDSYKVRSRSVVQWPLHGGKACPSQTDWSGRVTEIAACNVSIECDRYSWSVDNWGPCYAASGNTGCGYGFKMRKITCRSTSNDHVAEDKCHSNVGGVAPAAEMRCYVPCPADCRVSEWSAFGPCSTTCGSTGVTTRTRTFLFQDSNLQLSELCGHIALSETSRCRNVSANCPQYAWVATDWLSCVPQTSGIGTNESAMAMVCGEGTQRRHVTCRSADGLDVPSHHCDVIPDVVMPTKSQPCNIPCPIDCQVSVWSQWSSCSKTCGTGVKSRQRQIVKYQANGGRVCPRLEQTTTCQDKDCGLLDWTVSQWGTCKPNNNMVCGTGLASRTVECPIGVEALCYSTQPKPPIVSRCVKPCYGDCSMSGWSEWTQCNCDRATKNATRSRQRRILNVALPSGAQCQSTVETESCTCHEYALAVGEWTSCMTTTECGKGIQLRPVNCIRQSDGASVGKGYCSEVLSAVMVSQLCSIECPLDCVLGKPTRWSTCSGGCDQQAVRHRHVAIVSQGNQYGRQCPDLKLLHQTMTCYATPCFTYSWHREAWSSCNVTQVSCSIGIQTRNIECIRSDGTPVHDRYCLMDTVIGSAQTQLDLTISQKLEHDLLTEKFCGRRCPRNCIVSEWSEFGPCFKTCDNVVEGITSWQVRTRHLLQLTQRAQECPGLITESRQCTVKDSLCSTAFQWVAGDWTLDGKRLVNCSSRDGTQVTGGCVEETKPPGERTCQHPCSDYAECDNGICVCNADFIGDGVLCLPLFGCYQHDHCLWNDTHCDKKSHECLCWDGSYPHSEFGCSLIVSPEEVKQSNQSASWTEFIIYLVIGVVCSMLVLFAIVILIIVRRRRKRGEKVDALRSSLMLTKLENFENERRNNKSYNSECRKSASFKTASTSNNTPAGSNRIVDAAADKENHIDDFNETDVLKSTDDDVALDLDSMTAQDIYLTLLKSGGDYYAAESPSPGSPELNYRPPKTSDAPTNPSSGTAIGLDGDGDRTVVLATSSASDDDHVIIVDSGWRPRVSRPKLSAHEDGLFTLSRSGTLPAAAANKSKTKYNPVLMTSAQNLASSPPQQSKSAKPATKNGSVRQFKRSKSDGVDPALISSVSGVRSFSKTKAK